MKIILEGPDNSGKTTLANHVMANTREVMYHHPGGAPANREEELKCLDTQYALLCGRSKMIMDRVTCISQQVYNPNDLLDLQRSSVFDMVRELPDVVVVYCRPPIETLVDVSNFTWRAEETEEHRQKIITRAHEFVERYDQVMSKIPCISYDFKDTAHAGLIRDMMVRGFNGYVPAFKWFKSVIEYGSGK